MKTDFKPEFSNRFILFFSSFFLLSISYFANAQPFGIQNVLTAGRTYNADQIELIDLNLDNLPDIVTSCDLGLTWFENAGAGSFYFQASIFSQYPRCDFGIADFNDDQSPDLLIAEADSNLICWSPNNGYGNYDSIIKINRDSLSPKNLVICDLDMDSDLDFLVSYSPYNRSVCYNNDGAGNFTQTEINSIPFTGKVTGDWDFDSDGDPDLLISNSDNLTVLENNGSGNFIQAYPIVDFWPGESQWKGDLDSDGDKDLILYNNMNELIWIENTGSLLYIISHPIGYQYSVRSVSLADFDLDNDLDIISGTYNSGYSVFENLGLGTFNQILQDFDNAIVPAVGACDLDEDGFPDFVAIYGKNWWKISDQAAWFRGLGDLVFEEPRLLTSMTKGPLCIVATDLNGDQEKDIVTVSKGDNRIGWFMNIGYQTYASYNLITDTLINTYACEYAMGGVLADDLDLDGDNDLIAYSCESFVLLNDGSGMFCNAFEFGYYLTEVHDICLDDLDNDGYNDIIAGCYQGIKAFKNNGDGTYSETFYIPVNWVENSVTTGDIDGDGDPDIIFCNSYNEKIGYALNDGNGEFQEVHYIIDYVASYSRGKIRAADIDKDGDPDIILSIDHKIVWYENIIDAWGEAQTIVPPPTDDYCLADVDGDSDMDIIYPKYHEILWMANDGTGNFAEGDTITGQVVGLSKVFSYDLDNDDDPDFFSTSNGDDKVAWYENLRLPLYVPELPISVEIFSICPVPANNFVQIKCNSGNIQEVKLWDLSGKSVLHFHYSSASNLIHVNINTLKPGLYFIECKNEKGFQTVKKIVKV